MIEFNKVVEIGTHYSYEIECNECNTVLDSEKCDGCTNVLFECADYREGDTNIFHIETKTSYFHFCSKECAKEYLKERNLSKTSDLKAGKCQ